jgi:hypothetical protein
MAIQLRRGNEADFTAGSLLPAEPAYCLDTGRLVIGDGEGGADIIPTGAEVEQIITPLLNEKLDKAGGTITGSLNVAGNLASGGLNTIGSKLLYNNASGLQLTAGMNIPLNDSTSKYTHLVFDALCGADVGKRLHMTEASGEINFTATNLVNAPSTSTYHAIFEAVLSVGANNISVTSFRRVVIAGGSTYTPSYDENVTVASWTIYRIIGLKLY